MSQLLRSVNDQARGGARLSADDATTYVHEPDDGSTMASMATDHAAATLTSTEVTAAVGEVRLTIRSSKSPLSESPLGPSASSGMAWATGRTHTHSARLMTTSSRDRIAREHTPGHRIASRWPRREWSGAQHIVCCAPSVSYSTMGELIRRHR